MLPKGQPLPLHEPRWKTAMGLGYALSPTGAEHMANIHDSMYVSEEAPAFVNAQNLGILEPVDTLRTHSSKGSTVGVYDA